MARKRIKTERTAAYKYGIRAESLAGLYLRAKGYKIVASRYRNHLGEIDILASKRKTLIAIEVKARKNLTDCNETVPPVKQAKIARALEGFLAGHQSMGGKSAGLGRAQPDNIRFDVIWMSPHRWPVHIKDAFRM